MHKDEFHTFSQQRYSLMPSEVQSEMIAARIEKNPRGFLPHDFEQLFKIVMIGESNTGKTSMLLRFAENTFSENYLCTIGVDFKIKTLKVDGRKLVKMQIWDTAGQERFRSISQAYYRNSHGCIAVYDITSMESFQEIEAQVANFIAYSSQEVAKNIILVGNKLDLEDKRKVDRSEAVALARKLNLAALFETSAKCNQSVDDVFFRSIINCVDIYTSSHVNYPVFFFFHRLISSRGGGDHLKESRQPLYRSRIYSDQITTESQWVSGIAPPLRSQHSMEPRRSQPQHEQAEDEEFDQMMGHIHRKLKSSTF